MLPFMNPASSKVHLTEWDECKICKNSRSSVSAGARLLQAKMEVRRACDWPRMNVKRIKKNVNIQPLSLILWQNTVHVFFRFFFQIIMKIQNSLSGRWNTTILCVSPAGFIVNKQINGILIMNWIHYCKCSPWDHCLVLQVSVMRLSFISVPNKI